ncbi:MAG: type I glyceraldehyde-3-phosphate dehydrogenase [Proteobacteria bacterium]|nr:type I glyceraldehyde-3-phosphate dehydrogenase [Pseudomonadota bacterium]
MKIAINGFGRIGRSIYRIISQNPDSPYQVVAINDLIPVSERPYLLKYDSVMRTMQQEVQWNDPFLSVGKQKTKMLAIKELDKLPWKELGVDVVIEASGVFTERAKLEMHLSSGAKKVLLTVPPKDEVDALVTFGINDEMINPEHKLISNASCTTNCLAPIAKVLSEEFGIEKGLMTTVHSYTNDQNLVDSYHKDARRGRAAAENIIPTTTGAAKIIGKIIPELKGKIDGIAMRVPTVNGSIVDFTAQLTKTATVESVNAAIKKAAEGKLSSILSYCEDPIVSSDIIGNPKSSIFDAQCTKMIGDNFVKVMSWYDNEWGYSNRIVDLLGKLK